MLQDYLPPFFVFKISVKVQHLNATQSTIPFLTPQPHCPTYDKHIPRVQTLLANAVHIYRARGRKRNAIHIYIERERERERNRNYCEDQDSSVPMAARKRASAATDTTPKLGPEKTKPETPPTEPPIRPAKFSTIFKFSLIFSIPYFYLIFSHYKIDYGLKKSILISALVSMLGFFITVKMIPVASKYVLRRNLFGYDINKKGTPDGLIKV